jgi:hypothetical protein
LLPKGGNLLEIRGLAGTSIDEAIHAGIQQGVGKHPEFKIVNSVEGDWYQTVAQKAVATVLPSLPTPSFSVVSDNRLDVSRLEKTVWKSQGMNRLDKQLDALTCSTQPFQIVTHRSQ